jgi:hydroxymethylpyrimidine pyrophosphatase-like HAD family hydrolase
MPRNPRAEALVMDIDGTLTPPREEMKREMADALANLRVPFFVAAGSDLPLVKSQFFDPLKKFRFHGRIEAFLNNGAAQYRCDYSSGYSISMIKKFDIRKHLGNRHYADLVNVLKETLHKKEFKLPASVKVTGEQIIDRGSMVNFAPFGRPVRARLTAGDLANRKNFVAFDRARHYRALVMAFLQSELSGMIREKNLKIMYGGQTSFDIVIKGMDKTNPVRILLDRGYQRIVFIGDALLEGGNDSVIMDFIGQWRGVRPCPVVAIKVENWQNTIDQFRSNCWLDEKRKHMK